MMKNFRIVFCSFLVSVVAFTLRADPINPCDSSPCENAGTCFVTGPGSFECGCLYPFVGPLCEFFTSPDQDVDGDGMPSGWENDNGLVWNVTNPQGSDADLDTYTDLEEFWADTHPNDTNSFFPLIELTNAPAGITKIVIPLTSTGRVYNILENTNDLTIVQVWKPVGPWLTGTASSIEFSITNETAGSYFRTAVALPDGFFDSGGGIDD